ncbi:MAG: enamine deaminase RidA (YjgF/YER057c/UK114 family) [Planctomycetota bacterium]|jgi:enamine deaminase RidA (YjgF/YER057c/UK114 family)
MKLDAIHPAGWAKASGYSNGVLVSGAGRTLYLAGQIAWDEEQRIVGEGDFGAQFEQALRNVVTIIETAGGNAHHLVRLTIFVVDKKQYMANLREIGAAYRDLVGRHYPAMSLVQVAALLEEGALLEIEATAVLPEA